MKIAIMSDSHGSSRTLKKAVSLAYRLGAQSIVHCGDICRKEDIALLACDSVPAWLVAGNMDKHWPAVYKQAQNHNVTFDFNSVEIPIENGQYLAAIHGQVEHLLVELVQGGQFPYVCHGHTHYARDYKFQNTRVICPGSLKNPRFPNFETITLLDTLSDDVKFYRVSDGSDASEIVGLPDA